MTARLTGVDTSNTVNSKGDIGSLDDQQCDKQWCRHTPSVLNDEEAVAMHSVGHWIEFAEPPHDDVL